MASNDIASFAEGGGGGASTSSQFPRHVHTRPLPCLRVRTIPHDSSTLHERFCFARLPTYPEILPLLIIPLVSFLFPKLSSSPLILISYVTYLFICLLTRRGYNFNLAQEESR